MTDEITTEEELVLSLHVGNEQWVGLFDSIEVWRSRSGPSGPWEALTAEEWSAARLPKGAANAPASPATGPSAVLVGKVLNLRVQEDVDIDITFTGADPLTFAQAAAQIETQGLGLLRSYVVGPVLVIETVKVGSAAILRVVGGDAAALLSLPTSEPSNLAFGREARPRLAAGRESYTFTDHNGDSDYYYKTRFYNSLEGSVSAFGEPFSGASITGIAAGGLVVAYCAIVDPLGKTSPNLPILLHSRNRGSRQEGKTVIGGDVRVLTDEDGRAEFTVVRGQQYTVAIGGTDVVRDFTAPTDTEVTSFDMFDAAYSSDDAFNVQRPNIVFAARRSV